MIEVVDLKKYYGSTRGVERVTLHVKQGEIFGFVGPNGSGKTTMIRTLLGLISKDGGSAKLFGNKKKVGLVVALMHQPKLLILDEPTSGLDPLIQSRFLEIITNEKKRGTTILLSSHVLSEIEKVCDRVALIKEGVILFTKTMDEIRQNEHKRLLVTPNHHDLVLEGLSFIQDFDQSSQYAYVGDVNLLVKFLSGYKFLDINIRNVGLEEIFAIYYEKEIIS